MDQLQYPYSYAPPGSLTDLRHSYYTQPSVGGAPPGLTPTARHANTSSGGAMAQVVPTGSTTTSNAAAASPYLRSVPPKSYPMATMDSIYSKAYSPRTAGAAPAPVLAAGHHSHGASGTSASQQFAYRFKPHHHVASTPHIIGLDLQAQLPRTRKRFNGFFPPVKLRSADRVRNSFSLQLQHDNTLQLEPVSDNTTDNMTTGDTAQSTADLTAMGRSSRAAASQVDKRSAVSTSVTSPYRRVYSSSSPTHTHHTARQSDHEPSMATGAVALPRYMFSTPLYPNNLVTGPQTCSDLTQLPKPKGIFPTGDLPWVYRHKVKRSMNELSKIMTSKVVVADSGFSIQL